MSKKITYWQLDLARWQECSPLHVLRMQFAYMVHLELYIALDLRSVSDLMEQKYCWCRVHGTAIHLKNQANLPTFLCAAFFTPIASDSISSSGKFMMGWLQQVFDHRDGNVSLLAERFWTSSLRFLWFVSLLISSWKRNRLKARCSNDFPNSTSWHV